MSFASVVAALSPTVWARLNDATGATTITDSSGNGHDGVVSSGVTFQQTGLLTGDSDHSALFNGTSVNSRIPYGSFLDAASTFSIFVVAKTSTATGTPQMLSRDNIQTPARLWQMRLNAGKFEFVKIPGTTTTASAVTGTADGTVHDYGVTYDGSNIRLYVDGVLVKTQAATGSMGTLAADLYIGNRITSVGATVDWWNGNLDEVLYKASAVWADSDFALLHTARIGDAADTALVTASTLTIGGTREQPGAVGMATVSTLTVGGTRDRPGATAFATTATLVATVGQSGAVALSAAGSLTVDGTVESAVAVALGTVAGLTVGGVVERPGAAALSITATLGATVESGSSGAADLVATSTLTAAASVNTLEILGTSTIITVSVDSGDTPTFETMELVIEDPTQRRAPTAVLVILNGADPGEEVDFTIDGLTDVVWVAEADSNGSLFLVSVDVPDTVGTTDITSGTHTLHATGVDSGKTASDTFTLDMNPPAYPEVQAGDVDPVEVPGRGNRWALQDPLPGGLGSWIMVPSPTSMSEPHLSKLVTVDHSTNPIDGQYHIEVADTGVKDWSFSGFCPNRTFYETLSAYAELNRRFYVIDHRGRAWRVTFTKFDPKLRKRLINDDGTPQDWAADYTMTATIYNTDPLVPVTP